MKRKVLLNWTSIIFGILAGLGTATAQKNFFRSEVAGKGRPVILIPGLACDGNVWKGTVDQLEDQYQCHTLTLPGFSNVPPVKIDSSFTGLVVKKLHDYITEGKLKNPILIGHSLGGFISLDYALKYPKSASKLVIVDAVPYLGAITNPGIEKEQVKQMVDQIQASWQQMQGQDNGATRMMMSSMITDSAKIELAMEWTNQSDAKTVGQAMRDIYLTDLREEMASIKTETLVLGAWFAYQQYGMSREMIRGNYENQYQHHPNVTIRLSDTGRHFLMWDDPQWTASQIIAFLESDEL